MERGPLSVRHLEGILEVVREVSGCQDFESFRLAVVDSVQDLIGADLYHLMDSDMRTGSIEVLLSPVERAVPDDVAFAAFEYHHPIVDHFLESGDGSAVRLSDVISTEAYHQLPIYQDRYREHGVEFQLTATVPCPEMRMFSIGLNREDGDFTEAEVTVLDRLRPHLVQSARNVERRSRLDDLLESPTDDGVHGAALIRRGQIVEADDQVVDALRTTFGSEAATSALPAVVDRWSRVEARRLDGVDSETGARLHTPLVGSGEGGRVVLRWVRTEHGDAVLVDQRDADDARRLVGYGLTPRQADVLASLARGSTNAQIGRDLGISPHTVRKHLEHVYKKLSVESRTAAVALAYEVLSGRPEV